MITITYSIYILVTANVIVVVGYDLYAKGENLILELFQNIPFTQTVNKLLLLGYYLVNLGYLAITIPSLGYTETYKEVLELLGEKIGFVLILLGILHFQNIIVLHYLSRHKQRIIQFFNT